MKLSCAPSPDGPKLRHTRPQYRSMPKQMQFTLLGSRWLSLKIKTANPKWDCPASEASEDTVTIPTPHSIPPGPVSAPPPGVWSTQKEAQQTVPHRDPQPGLTRAQLGSQGGPQAICS